MFTKKIYSATQDLLRSALKKMRGSFSSHKKYLDEQSD